MNALLLKKFTKMADLHMNKGTVKMIILMKNAQTFIH